ncbi:MAG: hypothetical protein OHK0053_17540 [Microscillaceae bacterium]
MELLEKIARLSEAQQARLLNLVEAWLDGAGEDNGHSAHLPPRFTLYPLKSDYTLEDIRAIIRLFPKNKKWTCEDLQNEAIFPPDLKVRMQLLQYKLYLMPRPSTTHQEILTNIATFLNAFVRTNKLGKVYVAPFGLHIDEGTCLEPDIVLVLKPQLEKVSEKGLYEAPALVVEVISRANYKKIREAKKAQYASFGIEEYWEIYPNKQAIQIEVLSRDEAGQPIYIPFSSATKEGEVQSKVITGFAMELEEVFV